MKKGLGWGLALLLVPWIGCSDRTDAARTDAAPKASSDAYARADNTKVNERDSQGGTLTPPDQAENETDLGLTQRVRQAIVADDSLSTNAHNVKIITANGMVTLRGPVEDPQEKTAIETIAQQIAGVGRVDNQLEVINQ